MKKEKTCRGFGVINFKDEYNIPCSLQKSSLATEDAIWLGVDDPKPQILAYHINGGIPNGWVKYDIPKEVNLHTRMHLTREQVKELLPHLKKFVETGEI